MAMFISFAVAVTIGPSINRICPQMATERRPNMSDNAPTKGHRAAFGIRYPITSQI
jgi:hypothetical protein